jgi:hypothetical protein
LPESQVTDSPPLPSQISDEEYEESAQDFCQKMDRGDNVEDSYQYNDYNVYVEDYIDQATLVPYMYDDEDVEKDAAPQNPSSNEVL